MSPAFRSIASLRVAEVMSRGLVSCAAGASFDTVAAFMASERIRCAAPRGHDRAFRVAGRHGPLDGENGRSRTWSRSIPSTADPSGILSTVDVGGALSAA